MLQSNQWRGIAPNYLCELLEMTNNDQKNSRTRAAEDTTLLKLPKMSRLKASNRRFSNYAPEAWNSIPKELRSIADATAFKGKLKNYLYGQL